MQPPRSGAPSIARTARSGPSRSRIGASVLRLVAGMWSTTQTAAGKSAGRAETTRRSASRPPAEAAMATTRGGAPPRRAGRTSGPVSAPTDDVLYAPSGVPRARRRSGGRRRLRLRAGQLALGGLEHGHPAAVAALVVAHAAGHDVTAAYAAHDLVGVVVVVARVGLVGGQRLHALEHRAAVAVGPLVRRHGAELALRELGQARDDLTRVELVV